MADSHVNDPDPSGMAMPGLIDTAEPATPASAAAMPVSPILTGHVGRALLWLALPVLAEQALNICVGMTDIYLAGYVGSDATVAVGLAAHFGWLIVILFGLIGTAATALVARAIGRQAYDEANHVANQAVALGAGMGIVAAATVIFVAPWIPRLFGLESQAAGLATRYIRIDAIGHVLGGILGIGNACMRGAGDTRTPLRVMAIVNLCNVVVSAVLTLGIPGVLPRLGVVGIATGTACARIVGGLLVVATLSRVRSWFGPTILFGRTAPLLTLHRRQMRLQRATLFTGCCGSAHRPAQTASPCGWGSSCLCESSTGWPAATCRRTSTRPTSSGSASSRCRTCRRSHGALPPPRWSASRWARGIPRARRGADTLPPHRARH